MNKFNLEELDLDELKTLQKNVAKAIQNYEARKRREALQAIEAVAREKGYSLSDLTGAATAKSARTPHPPKYQHPENAALTWSGRGRQPAWVKEHLKADKPLDELLIKK
ncbi:H-NS histone family protein [Thioclava sp. NG1]|uniref:H-NS histone family protein n=1 Tax=unclassified Thioclava TaxID=2621713 RepID=UPI000B539CAA|nr:MULTISPECIES: H-NS histone family protein [unclassified Thioclava]OWY10310.1 transcriptional regulator [Thioclava sp. F34-6]PWE48346.1 H-NS histone family protein [Thioclava sp. NG1]